MNPDDLQVSERVTLVRAQAEDEAFAFAAKRAALGPYVETRWGWDDEAQLELHRRRWSERCWFLIQLSEPSATVGTVALDDRDAQIRIGEFYVLPEYQRLGVGTAILGWLARHADARGIAVGLEVLKWNPARRLYDRSGFRIVEETDTHFEMIRPPSTRLA